MDYIWIILLAISAIIIAVYSKKVDKAEHPASYKKEGKKGKKAKKAKKAKAKPVADEDDYSISEELTDNGNRMNILYLFIAAVAVFGLVVLFSVLFSCFAV